MPSSYEVDLEHTARRAYEAAKRAWGEDWQPVRGAVAPGRIEILGNHVDYNGGPVIAAAIDRATVVLSDGAGECELLFADFPDSMAVTIDLDDPDLSPSSPGSPTSADYARGAVARARSKGQVVHGGRSVVATSVPIGSGMSSSAALCVALTLVLNQAPLSSADLVFDAQAAENWTGVPCGTMDQSASVFGHVIRFEGPEGTTSMSPALEDCCFVVVESRVERTLGTSSYPVRVRECAEAVRLLEEHLGRPVGNLASISVDELNGLDGAALPPPLDARARHIVTEVARVKLAETALQGGDWVWFGELMNASGESSAGDYAISHPQVEALVTAMRSVQGVLGARMMGGGEGGATLALLRIEALPDLRSAVSEFFRDDLAGDAIVPLAFAPGARPLSTEEIGRLIQYPRA